MPDRACVLRITREEKGVLKIMPPKSKVSQHTFVIASHITCMIMVYMCATEKSWAWKREKGQTKTGLKPVSLNLASEPDTVDLTGTSSGSSIFGQSGSSL